MPASETAPLICGECGRRLSPDDFYASNRSTCKSCVKAAATARNRANPEAHREANRRWRKREQQRTELLEEVLRVMASRCDCGSFHWAVMKVEDDRYLDANTILEIFEDQTQKSRRLRLRGEGTTTTEEQDDAA